MHTYLTTRENTENIHILLSYPQIFYIFPRNTLHLLFIPNKQVKQREVNGYCVLFLTSLAIVDYHIKHLKSRIYLEYMTWKSFSTESNFRYLSNNDSSITCITIYIWQFMSMIAMHESVMCNKLPIWLNEILAD